MENAIGLLLIPSAMTIAFFLSAYLISVLFFGSDKTTAGIGQTIYWFVKLVVYLFASILSLISWLIYSFIH